MFLYTVASTLIRIADKSDKATETPAVAYPAALTSDIPLKQQRVGELGLFPSTAFFGPGRLKRKNS
jgi:hypothetical protein